MNRKTANILGGVLTASMLLAGITGCGSNTINGKETAVVVNGEEMPLGEANFILRYEQGNMYNYYSAFYSMYGVSMTGSFFDQASGQDEENPDQTQGEYLKKTTTDYIEHMMLTRQHAEEYGIALTDEQLQGAKDAAAAFVEKNGEEVMTRLGADEAMVADAFELYAYTTLMHDPMIADADIQVSDEEAQMSSVSMAYVIINSNMEEDEVNEKKEWIESFKSELEADPALTFSDLAASMNEELNKEKGNDESNTQTYIYSTTQGYAPNDAEDTSLAEELKAACQGLKDGEVYSEIIETDQGYYVVRMEQTTDEDRTQTRRDSMISDRQNEFYNELLEQWTEAASVSVKKCFEVLTVTDKDIYLLSTDSDEVE